MAYYQYVNHSSFIIYIVDYPIIAGSKAKKAGMLGLDPFWTGVILHRFKTFENVNLSLTVQLLDFSRCRGADLYFIASHHPRLSALQKPISQMLSSFFKSSNETDPSTF